MSHLTVFGIIVTIAALTHSNPPHGRSIDIGKGLDEADKTVESLADEINIVFGEHGKTEKRHSGRNSRRNLPRDSRGRRQSWLDYSGQRLENYASNLEASQLFQPPVQTQDLYGGYYDAYVSQPRTTQTRTGYSQGNQGYSQYNPYNPYSPPQYLPPPQQGTVNNYFIGIPIGFDPWRVNSPFFSVPFFFVPMCPNIQVPTEPPKVIEPDVPTKPDTDTGTGEGDNGSIDSGTGIDNRVGGDPNRGEDNRGNAGNVDRPSNRPVESPIDLTPAKPKRPLSRKPPPTDRSASSTSAPAKTSPTRVSNSNLRPQASTTRPLDTDFFSNRITTQEPLRTTTLGSVDPPSRCVWAIINCCNQRTGAYSTSCFENLGCFGAFWDQNPCLSEAARAANNAVSVLRDRYIKK